MNTVPTTVLDSPVFRFISLFLHTTISMRPLYTACNRRKRKKGTTNEKYFRVRPLKLRNSFDAMHERQKFRVCAWRAILVNYVLECHYTRIRTKAMERKKGEGLGGVGDKKC